MEMLFMVFAPPIVWKHVRLCT